MAVRIERTSTGRILAWSDLGDDTFTPLADVTADVQRIIDEETKELRNACNAALYELERNDNCWNATLDETTNFSPEIEMIRSALANNRGDRPER